MKRPLPVLAAAGSLLLALSAADVALAQKPGGILKMYDRSSRCALLEATAPTLTSRRLQGCDWDSGQLR